MTPSGSDAPHTLVAEIGHIDVPGGIQSHAVGEIELRVHGALLPSPLNPATPVPAMVAITPPDTLRTR